MMYLEKDKVNVEVFNLSQLVGADKYFLFQILDVNDETIKLFTSENITPSNRRYDKFNIELTSDEDFNTGKINLKSGQFTYQIWEWGGSTLSLDNVVGDKPIEIGKVVVETFNDTDKNIYD